MIKQKFHFVLVVIKQNRDFVAERSKGEGVCPFSFFVCKNDMREAVAGSHGYSSSPATLTCSVQ